jgi:hypothetical protein
MERYYLMHLKERCFKDVEWIWLKIRFNCELMWTGCCLYRFNGELMWTGCCLYRFNGELMWTGCCLYRFNGELMWTGFCLYRFHEILKFLIREISTRFPREGLLHGIRQLCYCIIGRWVSSVVQVKVTISLEETLPDNPAIRSPECDSSQYQFKLQSLEHEFNVTIFKNSVRTSQWTPRDYTALTAWSQKHTKRFKYTEPTKCGAS